MESKDTKLIFIVGVGRSGTSLLQTMLHAHEQICFVPETAFIRRFLANGLLAGQLRKGGKDAVFRTLSQDERVKRLGLPHAVLRDCIPEKPEQLPQMYAALIAAFAAQRGHFQFLGDKDPRNAEFLPWIHRHFPHAHIIHIFRDPRDVLTSKKKAAWSESRSWLFHVFASRVQFHLAHRWGVELFGTRYMRLAYEQLLDEPEPTLMRLCAFLELPYDSAMTQFAQAGKELVAADEMAWKKETLGPLLRENSGNWAQSLSALEIAACETLCGATMQAGGYGREARLFKKLYASLLLLPFQVGQGLYGVYRKWKQG